MIDDEVFIAEKNGKGVCIELPCFRDNIRELKEYLQVQNISVTAKLAAYHAAGPAADETPDLAPIKMAPADLISSLSRASCSKQSPAKPVVGLSRKIEVNRYMPPPKDTYDRLLELVNGTDYFILITNVDHCFQRAGFDRKRLFYTQGDYGLWQCSKACHSKTYDNEQAVCRMVAKQRERKIPAELIPKCPVCGASMTMNLRTDGSFVQDDG